MFCLVVLVYLLQKSSAMLEKHAHSRPTNGTAVWKVKHWINLFKGSYSGSAIYSESDVSDCVSIFLEFYCLRTWN